jgi:hypothetical protein
MIRKLLLVIMKDVSDVPRKDSLSYRLPSAGAAKYAPPKNADRRPINRIARSPDELRSTCGRLYA